MIAITRERTNTAIPRKFYGPNRVAWNIELLENERRIRSGEITNHDFDESRWKAVKEQLLKESVGKCVYCEAPASAVCYCDVEHYRPKSIYWWLAYSYENYLASCTLCNQKYKRDEFPIGGTMYPAPKVSKQTSDSQIRSMAPFINPDPLVEADGLAYPKFARLNNAEKAYLPNPYYVNPESVFVWKADEVLEEVEIAVKPRTARRAEIEAAVIENYGLNRLELKQLRYAFYEGFGIHKESVKNPKVPQRLKVKAQAKIDKMKLPKAPFAGMIRYFDSNI